MKSVKIFALLAILAVAGTEVNAMGYPVNPLTHRKSIHKPVDEPKAKAQKKTTTVVAKNPQTVKPVWAFVEPTVENVAVLKEENNNRKASAVELMSKVVVRMINDEGSLVTEKSMTKDELLSDRNTGFLKGSRFLALLEGVAYYFIEKKEDL